MSRRNEKIKLESKPASPITIVTTVTGNRGEILTLAFMRKYEKNLKDEFKPLIIW